MKPRLPAAVWTIEDLNIMWDWNEVVPGDGWDLIFEIYADADRRDADLMLYIERGYADIMHRGHPQWRIWHAACAFQGIPIPADYCLYD